MKDKIPTSDSIKKDPELKEKAIKAYKEEKEFYESCKPTLGEIVKESVKVVGKGIGKGVSKGISIGGKTIFYISTMPTTLRRYYLVEYEDNKSMHANAIILSMLFYPFYTGISVGLDHPELLLIPASTNLISGLYEIGKYAKKKVYERKLEDKLNKK